MRIDAYINFDYDFYREYHKDLSDLKNNHDLLEHYKNYGYAEGRIASPIAHRKYFVELIQGKKILEIGAFAGPLAKGVNVKYFDIFTTESLKNGVREVDETTYTLDEIVDVDYSSPDGSLAGIPETFEAIISSHNIEHQPDIINHLLEAWQLLNDGGAYYLLIPDAKHCYDATIPETTIGAVLDAHLELRKIHSLGAVVTTAACHTHNYSSRHWQEKKNDFPEINSQQVIESIKKVEASNGEYIDTHGWRFSPFTFSSIFKCLIEINVLPYKQVIVNGPVYGTNEFTAIFVK